MPESLFNRRLKLGSFLGIGLYVHWSFALVVAYVALSSYGEGAYVMAFAVLQLLGVFFCVTLHEYGHAAAARRFGIGTVDITLLPIGGVARLQRMPRIPWQELVVAVAGPAVNVVIVTLLVSGFFAFTDASVLYALTGYLISMFPGQTMDDAMMATMMEIFTTPSVTAFAVLMLVINLMLVLFNMIPAFPMDGGRVFRSLLAMTMDYRRATWIASRVGLVCAAVMAMLALNASPPHPIPVLIAVFIGYAGLAEARQVDVMETVRGLTVGQAMISSRLSLSMEMPLAHVAEAWRSIPMLGLPVVSSQGTVVGVLQLKQVTQALADGNDPMTAVGELIHHDGALATLGPDEKLETALTPARRARQIPVVDDSGTLVGILDLDSMLVRCELAKQQSSASPAAVYERFDQTS